MEKQGFIKLHRKIVDWEWYDDMPTFRLFIHLILKANHADQKWRGDEIKRGSCITSYATLEGETKLSKKQLERALKNLIETGEVEKVTSNKNTLIIVTKYNSYQNKEKPKGQQERNKGEAKGETKENKQEYKEVKNNKNDKKEYGILKNVLLTDEEYQKLKEQNALSYIDDLSTYIPNKIGKPYVNHYATILKWKHRDDKKNSEQSIIQTWEVEEETLSDEERAELIRQIKGS